ncbi:MAG: zinc ribbon domain-containing protein [Desulfobulbia bacterium]
MNTSVKAIFVFLALVLGVSNAPTQAATLPPNFDTSVLTDLHNELNGFGTDPAKQISNTLLDKAGVEQDGNAYTKKVNLFGKETTIFFMYGHKKNAPNVAVSVVAVMVPIDLTSKALFGDSVPGIGLKNPVVCYAKEDCDLLTADMPIRTQPPLKSIMPSQIIAAKGLNFFGTLTSSIEGFPYALPSEMFAGFATGKNEKGQKKYTINAAIIKPWSNPLGLQNTTMKGGMLSLRKEGEVKTTEVLGTASVGSPKEYTVYYKQEGVLQQSLGFDTRDASLKDFFSILDALGMPFESAKKDLPLTIVQLSNPNFQPKTDASAPPDFTKMLFKATRTGTGVFTELIANAEGAILKQKMASLILNASAAKKSVEGSAGVNAKLGPLNAGSANFYLTANLTSVPKMGLTVKSGLLGDLDLAASGNGLKLDVPADCPVRPIGFTASITDLGLTDFPITPEFNDCYSKEIMGIVNGTVAIAGDVGETVANGAAETAKTLSEEAQKTYAALHVDRVAAWGPALATHAAEVRSAKDAVQAADQAVNAAGKLIKDLGAEIGKLDDRIRDISNEIGKLLKKLWSLVSGQVKSLKKEKATKESERDKKRTEQAAAEQRKKQAEAVKAEATTALKEIPGPNITGRVAELNQQMLGVQAQQEVQAHVAAYAANLAGDFKNPGKRKEILSGVDTKAFIDERKTQFASDYPTLAKLMEKDSSGKTQMEQFLDGSKNALVVKAVSQKIEDETERTLRETVPTLPTMDFDVPVNIVYGEGSNARCLQAPALLQCTYTNEKNKLVPCTGAQNQVFRFRAGGDLVAGNACMMFVKFPTDRGYTTGGMQYLMKDCVDDMNWASYILSATKFFFDPIEGNFTAYFSNPGNPNGFAACITATNDVLSFTSECSTQKEGTKWRLVPVGQVKGRQAPPVQAIKARGAKPSAVPPPTTNLAPLQLR